MKYTDDFEAVYSHYPRKKGKAKAFDKWEKYRKAGDLPDRSDILRAIVNQKKERAFLKSQNRFVPEWRYFSTWMNQQGWEDEVELSVVRAIADYRPGTITVNTLDRALNVLRIHGEQKFDEFCRHLKFSPQDIEAVRNKFAGNYDIRRLAGGIG